MLIRAPLKSLSLLTSCDTTSSISFERPLWRVQLALDPLAHARPRTIFLGRKSTSAIGQFGSQEFPKDCCISIVFEGPQNFQIKYVATPRQLQSSHRTVLNQQNRGQHFVNRARNHTGHDHVDHPTNGELPSVVSGFIDGTVCRPET